ncbi:MAG: cadherin-like beta sandwich domain-containing protein [Eubacteriales bacterium]|nr:cadherin-like beta sandwich domain-containing protein [Eubacteriales bacterium]
MKEYFRESGFFRSKRFLFWLLLAVLAGSIMVGAPSTFAASREVEWGRFQNSEENNGIVYDRNMPDNYTETALKWGRQMVVGYTTSFTPPLIIDGALYTASKQNVYKIDKETGEVTASSDELLLNVGYAMNPITYDADHDQLYVPILNGRIACLSADDLTVKWTSAEYKGCQTLSPITYKDGLVYTGIWKSETSDGVYFALDWETGKSLWEFKPSETKHQKEGDTPRGFYWAGAYASDKALIFGSDDGQDNTFADTGSDSFTKTAILYSADLKTGDIIDKITEIKGDIRSTIVRSGNYLYFTTKGGWLCKVKLNSDGTFDHDTFSHYTMPGKGMMTASPVVYKGRIYVGVAGTGGQFNADGGHMFAVLRDDDMLSGENSAGSLLYTAQIPGYPQAAPLLQVKSSDPTKVRLYFTFNAFPGGIYYLEDDLSVITFDDSNKPKAELLFRPEVEMQQYCISPLACDRNGTIYIKNDSGYIMAVASNKAYLNDISVKVGDDDVEWTPDFESGLLKYDLRAPNGTEAVDVKLSVPEGMKAYINEKPYESGSKMSVPIDPEGDKIKVVVEKTVAGTDYKREYTLSISTASNDATLAGLLISDSNTSPSVNAITSADAAKGGSGSSVGYDPVFDHGVSDYVSKSYSGSKNFLNLWLRPTDGAASIKVYPVSDTGNNTAKSLNDDGTITAYKATNGNIRFPIYWLKNKISAVAKVEVTSASGNVTKEYNVTLVRSSDNLDVGENTLSITPGSLTLYSAGKERSQSLKAMYQDTDVTKDCAWESTDAGVASVDSEGNVSAGMPGSCEIWARYTSGSTSIRTYVHVTVKQMQADKPSANVSAGTYYVKKEIKLSTSSSGAEVHYEYNADGGDISDVIKPKTSSKLYDKPITLGVPGKKVVYRIRAIATGTNYRNSDTVDYYYTIDLREPVDRIELSGVGRDKASSSDIASKTDNVKVAAASWSGNTLTVKCRIEADAQENRRFTDQVLADLGGGGYASGTLGDDGSVTIVKKFNDKGTISQVDIGGLGQPVYEAELPVSAVSLTDGVSAGQVVWTKAGSDTVVTKPDGEGAYTAKVELTPASGYSIGKDCRVRFLSGGKYLDGELVSEDGKVFATCDMKPVTLVSGDSVNAVEPEKSVISGIENGAGQADVRKILRNVGANVKLNSGTTIRCQVTWEDTEMPYDPEVISEQEFSIKGKVNLPESVDAGGVNLSVFIKVKIAAGKVDAVQISPAAGIYRENTEFTLSTETKGASIIYITSLDNETKVYEKPIAVTAADGKRKAVTIKAYAIKNNVKSETKTFTVTVDRRKISKPAKVSGLTDNINVSKRRIALSWKKMKSADCYRLYWRKTGSKKWSSRKVTGTSTTLKSLKSKGMYQVRVRAENISGAGSFSYGYYYIAGSKLSISSGKKMMTLKMSKVKGSTGNYFCYSLKKSMKSSKSKYTGKSKYTVKKLKSKKYYYVQAAPYKKSGGKKYVGAVQFRKVKIK